MASRLRRHVTFSNVLSLAAIFIVLGGTSYAATKLATNAVKSRNIAKNAITSAKVKDGSLLRKDFKSGQIPAGPRGPAGATGPAGAKGDKGDKGDIGPSSATSVTHQAAGPNLSTTTLGIATLPLEAGSYFIAGKVNVFSTGAGALAVCWVRAGGSEDRAEGYVGNGAGQTIDLSLAPHLVVTLASAGNATLECGKDAAAPTVGTNGIRLSAIRLGSATSTAF